ncbi:MAG: lipoyl synthase, partial [archaeon]|nr:lipoyl synthase [archaeon]
MKPAWLKIRPPNTSEFQSLKDTISKLQLVTVCQEAHCPNMSECWSKGTATFMVLGETCTRGCKFCAVKTAMKGEEIDLLEPRKIAFAVKKFGLKYIVLTSVDRDDLKDEGAEHFANCIKEIKNSNPSTKVEALIPDFKANKKLIQIVAEAHPDVLAHNIETVKRLQLKVRDYRAGYEQSLKTLKTIKEIDAKIFTKSSIMLGLGEEKMEVLQTMDNLLENQVQVLTLGQYLKPSNRKLEVKEYVTPIQFDEYKNLAMQKGFLYCASGPFVRSSYKAAELFLEK